MKVAYIGIREAPVYRRSAFERGLKALGYAVRATPPVGKPGDVLVTWNRYWANHDTASKFEAAGGTVVVAENGYLRGPKDGGDYYALALHAHNGRGVWPDGGPGRWNALGVALQPWRATGEHVLVCANRPFGQPGAIMPADWADDVRARLARITKREIRVRLHPGMSEPSRPLGDDLRNCWAVVIWSSGCGVRALIAGIPVLCEAPYWICKDAAGTLEQIEAPPMPDRLPVMQRLAWAQWDLREIASGEAFRSLLSDSRKIEGAAAL